MKRFGWAACVLIMASITACGPSGKTPADECAALAAAVATAAQRCGGDYQQSYQSFLDQAACGDCNNIAEIQDQASLDSQCIPSLSTISCSDLQNGVIDMSCSMQFVRQACSNSP